MSVVKNWPGTISLRAGVLLDALTDIVGSLAGMGFYRIVLVSSHGNHDGIIKQLVRNVADQYKVWIAAIPPYSFAGEEFYRVRKSKPGGAIHAGEFETALMLYYDRPVDMSKATDVDLMRYSSEFSPADHFCGKSKPVTWSTWGLQQSQTGVYGDPTPATKATGEKIARAMVDTTVAFLKEYCRQTKKPDGTTV